MEKKHAYAATSLALLVLSVVLVLDGCNGSDSSVTKEEAQEIARERVIADYNYKNLNGYDLKLKSSSQQSEGCYSFVYEYKVDQDEITGVDRIEAGVLVVEGEPINFSYTEISGIFSFQECVDAGYEILYPDCEGCSEYCETPDGRRFVAQQQDCTDNCGDGICSEEECFEPGCSCIEDEESCPQDC